MKQIRKLTANEIDARVQIIRADGCSLLLYKDARVDMKILDETFGPNNWQRSHEVINDNLFCNIDIWDAEKNTWVRKQDVGVESYTEKEKGQASDAFKRAGFNVGIGRELYTAPFIWISLSNGEVSEQSGKPTLKAGVRFSVKDINYDTNGNINQLTIIDNKGKVRFEMRKPLEKSDIKIAVLLAENAKDATELMRVWNLYKDAFGEHGDFKKAVANNPNNPKK